MKSVLSGKPVAQFVLFVVSLLISISGYETWLKERHFADTWWEGEHLMALLMTILPGITAVVTIAYLILMKRFRSASIILAIGAICMGVADTIADNANRGVEMRTPQSGMIDTAKIKSDGIEVLETYISQRFTWYVLGRIQSGKLVRYSAPFCSYGWKMSMCISDYIPECFSQYATVISQCENLRGYRGFLLTTYLTWKFPEYRIGLVCVDSESGEIVSWASIFFSNVLNYTYPTHMQVIPPKPLIRELLTEPERLIQRFFTYWNIVRYTFWSPFTRTDLMDDPIFRVRTLTLDEIDELDLPEKRKEVLRRCVRERVERERERAVKAAAEADSMAADDRMEPVEL